MDQEDLRERYGWKKVVAPKAWRPEATGEELIGFYGGKTTRVGAYGQYDVVLVHVPNRGSFMLTGVRVIQLVDASCINKGWPIRVVWKGHVDLDGDKRMKDFDVYTAEGDPLSEEDMPLLRPQRPQHHKET